ncbi:MAG: hypothetical protein NT136_00740 [Candidatus Moranbacteria bacterium]|nr:hypothetical protein [Candidatus Moranbacteria bacterium]
MLAFLAFAFFLLNLRLSLEMDFSGKNEGYLYTVSFTKTLGQGLSGPLVVDPNSELWKGDNWKKWENVNKDLQKKLKSYEAPCGPTDIGCWFKQLLYSVFRVVALFLGIAGVLFGWVIKPDNVYLVLRDNEAIYAGWKAVRDFLNLTFILVLLFSAFCTIFQVEKYNLKKILLTLVIMALLVNFSFPIARFIIDVSNVTFYFIINNAFSGGNGEGIFTSFANYSELVGILTAKQAGQADFWYLIMIIIFTFILMITLFVIAILFIIRLAVLAILIILSPVGFVAAIFPSTKHYADEWWESLFKYSFFAPIMGFAMYLSLRVLEAMKQKGIDISFLKEAQKNVSGDIDPNMFGKMAFFAIPVIMLWVGIIASTKLAGGAGNWVAGQAKKFAGWARRQPWRGTKALVGATGIPGGAKQAWSQFRRTGKLFGKQTPIYRGSESRAESEAKWATRFGVRGAREQDIKRRAEEMKKNNVSVTERKDLAARGNAAAVYSLADDKLIDQETYDKFLAANKDKDIHETLDFKLKQTRTDLIAIRKSGDQEEIQKVQNANPNWNINQVMDHIVRQEMGKMNAEKWSDQDWDKILAPPPQGATPTQVQDWQRKIAATQWTFSPQNMTASAQSEIRKRINPNKKAALNAQNIPV